MPIARCARIRCPVELTGRYSVTPSTTPSTTACHHSMTAPPLSPTRKRGSTTSSLARRAKLNQLPRVSVEYSEAARRQRGRNFVPRRAACRADLDGGSGFWHIPPTTQHPYRRPARGTPPSPIHSVSLVSEQAPVPAADRKEGKQH